jgi:hypothetical protein
LTFFDFLTLFTFTEAVINEDNEIIEDIDETNEDTDFETTEAKSIELESKGELFRLFLTFYLVLILFYLFYFFHLYIFFHFSFFESIFS